MIRWTLHTILERRGWTAYRLAQEADITMPVAYKLADPEHTPTRIDVETFGKLCRALKVQPGKFLKWENE